MVQPASRTQGQLRRQVGSLSLREPVRIRPNASLREAARRLQETDMSAALIGEEQREIVTERDITSAIARGYDPDDPVEPIATRVPFWVTTTSQVSDAAGIMLRHDVRHLVVLASDGSAVGVVAMRDILNELILDDKISALGEPPNKKEE